MALIECRECGKEFSDRAVACPACGDPVDLNVPQKDPAQPAPAKSQAPISQVLFAVFNFGMLAFWLFVGSDGGSYGMAFAILFIPWIIGNIILRVFKSVEKGISGK